VWCGPLVESLWRRGGRVFAGWAVAVVVVAAGLMVVTGGARKKLHAPIMADGSTAVDNREEVALLEDFFGKPDRSEPRARPAVEGPLLMLRLKHLSPVNTAIFYSGRPVQRVVPGFVSMTAGATDRYMYDPIPMAQAIADGPRMLLVDRDLGPAVELNWNFTPVAVGKNSVLGLIERPSR
jgi:hypothetical protein